MNKKNVLIKIFEPTERRKYVFCGLKSALGVIMAPCARVFAPVLRYMRNQYLYIWPQKTYFLHSNPKSLINTRFLFAELNSIKNLTMLKKLRDHFKLACFISKVFCLLQLYSTSSRGGRPRSLPFLLPTPSVSRRITFFAIQVDI